LLDIYQQTISTMQVNKSNADKYIINPLITGVVAGAATAAFIGNWGTVPFMGSRYTPAVVIGSCAAIGSVVASAVEDPVRNAPALKNFGELTDRLLQPILVGSCTLAAVAALVGPPKDYIKGPATFFLIGATGEVVGSYFGDAVKSAM